MDRNELSRHLLYDDDENDVDSNATVWSDDDVDVDVNVNVPLFIVYKANIRRFAKRICLLFAY